MFDKDFLWGSASAAYQIEGGASIDGKGPSIWDVYSRIPGNTYKNTNGEVAIDFYHKYEEDIALMKEMGLKAYRFSVSWPRILPKGRGEVNPLGVEFYHKVIDKLIENGIEPILTIYHWDLPQTLQEAYNGWESRNIIEDFANYCTILFKEYGCKVKYWITLNEQNVFTTLGYLKKLHPPKISDYQRFLNVNHHAFLANARAIELFRTLVPNGLVGPSFAFGPAYAKTCNPDDVLAMENAEELNNFFWMDVYARGEYSRIQLKLIENMGYSINFEAGDKEVLKKGIPDFMGVNYYQTHAYESVSQRKDGSELELQNNTVQSEVNELPYDKLFKGARNTYVNFTDWNWAIDPKGLKVALRRIESRYGLPSFISENGLGAYDKLVDGKVHDHYRSDFIEEHVNAIKEAIEEGCNVLGYCTWSFQDLFSWLNGYSKRYGFVYVDRDEENEKELKRYKKDSFYRYKEIIEKYSKIIAK